MVARSKIDKTSWTIAIVLAACLLVYWCWSDYQSQVVLLPHGKAAFYRGGFFHRDKFELAVSVGTWRFFRCGDLGQDELIVPFECAYNNSRILRLEGGGKVYLVQTGRIPDKTDRGHS